MKIKDIKFPTPLSEIKDIENDNIDVSIELEDGIVYTVVVSTPKNLIWYMEKENKNYIEASPPDIIVRTLTEENIREAVESYAEGDGYWLKLYYLAGVKEGVFETKNLNKLVKYVQED